MSNLFLKRVGLTVALGMASMHVLAASSNDFVDDATEAGIAEVVAGNLAQEKAKALRSRPSPSRWSPTILKPTRSSATSPAP